MGTINYEEIRNVLEDVSDTVHKIVGKIPDAIAEEDGNSGDIVSNRDRLAADCVRRELKKKSPYPCKLLDEESSRWVDLHDKPVVGYICDPIDGTRQSLMAMPNYTSTFAAFPLANEQQLRDVQVAVVRCADGELFSAQRGRGVWRNGVQWQVPRRDDLTFANARLHYDFAGGEPTLGAAYLAPFMASYLKRGVVVMNSSAYSITRLLLGAVDVYIHTGAFLWREWSELAPLMVAASGDVHGAHIWDLAPISLLIGEADSRITRVDGSSLDDAKLDDKQPLEAYDIVATADRDLHEAVVKQLMEQHRYLKTNGGREVTELAAFFSASLLR